MSVPLLPPLPSPPPPALQKYTNFTEFPMLYLKACAMKMLDIQRIKVFPYLPNPQGI